jgi:hypothetical protein
MARAALRPPAGLARAFEWIIDLAYKYPEPLDPHADPRAQTEARERAIRGEIEGFLTWVYAGPLGKGVDAEPSWGETVTTGQQLLNLLHDGLRAWQRGGRFEVPGFLKRTGGGLYAGDLLWGIELDEHRQLVRRTLRFEREATPDIGLRFFAVVFDVLTLVGPWVRVCQRNECGRPFLYQRREQQFHDASCAARARMTKFLSERAAGTSKAQRGRRKQPAKGRTR